MEAIRFSASIGGRKLEDLTANELRAKLITNGIDIPVGADKSELIRLVKERC